MEPLPGPHAGTPEAQQGAMLTTALTATSRVLQTTELLEAILMEMPDPRRLLLSERTCRAFRGTIRGSLHLRRKLFLSPAEPGSLAPTENPLIARIACRNLIPSDKGYRLADRIRIIEAAQPEAVFKVNGSLYALTEIRRMRRGDHNAPLYLPPPVPRCFRPAFVNFLGWSVIRVPSDQKLTCRIFDLANSSLRNMLLTQAPVDITAVVYTRSPDVGVMAPGRFGGWDLTAHAMEEVTTERGSTVGEIMTMIDKMSRKYDTCADMAAPMGEGQVS